LSRIKALLGYAGGIVVVKSQGRNRGVEIAVRVRYDADLARHAAVLMREDMAVVDEQASDVGMTMLGSRKFMRSRTWQ
jgi:hypothetical protein